MKKQKGLRQRLSQQSRLKRSSLSIRVLGIDPGVHRMGYGILEKQGSRIFTRGYGVVETTKEKDHSTRLHILYKGLCRLFKHYQPDVLSVERLFFTKNIKTAMCVGEAKGVVMLSAAQSGCKVIEFAPNEVKIALTGYGKASKKQLQKMVQSILKLDKIPKPDDAADALALAYCALVNNRFSQF